MKICEYCKKEMPDKNKRYCSLDCTNQSKLENLVGQKFGRLTIIKRVNNKRGRVVWNCLCECGKEKDIIASDIKSGNNKSCGCLQRETKSLIYSKPYGESSFNCLFRSYQRSAKKRNYSFELTKDEFKNLVDNNCYYCGSKPNKEFVHNSNKYFNGHYIYNGIDRLNSLKGYDKENSVSCCSVCNFMKKTYTESFFLSHIQKILEFQKIKKS